LTWLQNTKISANVTNLTNTKGVSTAVVTSTSGGYQAYPLPPIMGFLTLQAGF
jgi:outer membrane receptor protein involved in Fe transport